MSGTTGVGSSGGHPKVGFGADVAVKKKDLGSLNIKVSKSPPPVSQKTASSQKKIFVPATRVIEFNGKLYSLKYTAGKGKKREQKNFSPKEWDKIARVATNKLNAMRRNNPAFNATGSFSYAKFGLKTRTFEWKSKDKGSHTVSGKKGKLTPIFKSFDTLFSKTVHPKPASAVFSKAGDALSSSAQNDDIETIPHSVSRLRNPNQSLYGRDLSHYLRLLEEENKKKKTPAFANFDYSEPLKYEHIKGTDLMEIVDTLKINKTNLLYPIIVNIDKHYVLIMLDFKNKQVCYYDSLGPRTGQAGYNRYENKFKKQLTSLATKQGWQVVTNAAQDQNGTVHCGAHVLDVIEKVLEGTAFNNYQKPTDMNQKRTEIADRLVKRMPPPPSPKRFWEFWK